MFNGENHSSAAEMDMMLNKKKMNTSPMIKSTIANPLIDKI